MPRRSLAYFGAAGSLVIAFCIAGACPASYAQLPVQSPASQPEQTTLPSGIERLAGTESTSHIQYTRLVLRGSLHTTAKGAPDPPAPSPPPVLIAQCTLRPSGKYLFEMFTSFGGATDLAFYPPWMRASPGDLFPPPTDKFIITMEFLGYTHVKPVRRQWEVPLQPPGQYRYNSPGSGSPNLEEIAFYLRYLLALPTLRLTLGDHSSEFLTTPLLDAIRKEPLCRAAGI